MKPINKIILIAIIILSLALRFYKLDKIPPALSWDEASFSYNAYTIANWGKDEWGKILPLTFESFGEYKNPVDIYITAPFVKIFGLNEYATRTPAALFGVLNVILIYFLARRLFKNEFLALSASFFLAVSPYNLQFSRHHHELNIALFFFLLGLILFYKAINKKAKWFPWAIVSFCLSILTYNAAKLIVPLAGVVLVIIYFKELLKIKKYVLIGILPLLILGIIFVSNKNLTGLTRFKQTSVQDKDIYNTYIYKKTHNRRLGRIEIILRQYPLHFSYKYLFVSGDANPRHSIQTVGEFYKSDLPFLLLGFIYLIYLIAKKKSKESLFMLLWILAAPLPSAMAGEAPHAARSMFMLGSWQILSAMGLTMLVGLLKNKAVKTFIVLIFLISTGFYFTPYLQDYYQKYSAKYAIDWQYGMKQIVKYLDSTKGVKKVYMTIERSQPHIFYLYHLKTPLPEYLDTVKPNTGSTSGVSRINSFGKYYFGNWNVVESAPVHGVYYVMTPFEYSGVRNKDMFNVKNLIRYPDGSDAFYIITGL